MQGVWALIHTIQTKNEELRETMYHSYIIGKRQKLIHNVN